jgi:hypothetical protein
MKEKIVTIESLKKKKLQGMTEDVIVSMILNGHKFSINELLLFEKPDDMALMMIEMGLEFTTDEIFLFKEPFRIAASMHFKGKVFTDNRILNLREPDISSNGKAVTKNYSLAMIISMSGFVFENIKILSLNDSYSIAQNMIINGHIFKDLEILNIKDPNGIFLTLGDFQTKFSNLK